MDERPLLELSNMNVPAGRIPVGQRLIPPLTRVVHFTQAPSNQRPRAHPRWSTPHPTPCTSGTPRAGTPRAPTISSAFNPVFTGCHRPGTTNKTEICTTCQQPAEYRCCGPPVVYQKCGKQTNPIEMQELCPNYMCRTCKYMHEGSL